MTPAVPISKKREKCFACGKQTHFLIAEGAGLYREATCEHCSAGKRNADLARMILVACLDGDDGCLADDAPKLAGLHIYNTSAFGKIHELLCRLPHYTCSEYLDGVPLGDVRDGVRCEDLTQLSFEGDAFDVVISEEILEHVQDLRAALLEVRRVLKPGGVFLFTTPVSEGRKTRARAVVDDTGRVVHRLSAVYHGDIARPEGSLVFTDFGDDLPEILAAVGMPTEDHLLGNWYTPDEVTWIDTEAAYAAYRRHYENGTLFSAFRLNSHVFVARNVKLSFTGERYVPESTAPVLSEYEHVHRYAFALDFIAGRVVLDIACGEGFGSALLASRAERVIGVDLSEDTVRYARQRYGAVGNLSFTTGACEAIPCGDRSIDVIVSMETIEHIPDPQRFLTEVRRVLKPDGVLLVSTPNPECRRVRGEEDNPFHVRELTSAEFRERLQALFKHVRVYGQRALATSFIQDDDVPEASLGRCWGGDAHALSSRSTPGFVPKFYLAVCSDDADALKPAQSLFVSARHQDLLDTCVSPVTAEKLLKQHAEVSAWAKDLERQALQLLTNAGKGIIGRFRRRRQIFTERRKLLGEVERLNRAYRMLLSECDRLRRAVTGSGTLDDGDLKQTLARIQEQEIEAEHAKTSDRVKDLEAERDGLRREFTRVQEYVRELEATRESLQHDFNEAEAYAHSLEEVAKERQIAAAESDGLREQLAELHKHVAGLEEQRDSLQHEFAEASTYAHSLEAVLKEREVPVATTLPPPSRKAVCTICSNNYLHFARTLMASLRETQPDWDQYVLLCDENRGVFESAAEPFNVIEVAELDLPDKDAFCFRYTILELNTAVKPWLLERLFEKGYDQVVYLDPDIYVYEPLAEVEALLAAGNFAVLTPHLTGRLDDDAKPSELEILRAGSYNLGFIALRQHDSLGPFLKWWQEKVEFDCVVDFENGLFVDQKWIELMPGMFGDVALLRHEGYNVAYWNLKHRKVTARGGKFLVNGQPLVFFHFSGLDPENPKPFSKHQDRFRLRNLGVVRKLVKPYVDAVMANGLTTCRQWPYAFGRFTDGTPILDLMRYYYRQHLEGERGITFNPFELGHDYFHQSWGNTADGGPLVTLLMRAIWEYRKDLQEHYPDIASTSRWDYAYWFAEVIGPEFDVPECCINLVRRSLFGPEAAVPDGEKPSRPVKIVRPGGGSLLRRVARRVLPRPVKRWVKQLLAPDAGSSPRQRRAARRLARFLPGPLRRRLTAGVARPGQALPLPPRQPVHIPTPAISGTHYIGFFDNAERIDAGGLVWVGTSASVHILKPRAGTLRIFGEYIPQYHVQAGGKPMTALHLELDDVPVGDIHLSRHGLFEREIRLPEPASSRSATLTLEPSQHFVPAEIGIGADKRRLSLRISRIELEDTVLLDFSRYPSPYMPDTDLRHADFGLNIIGYLQSELGVGESARLCAASAEAAGVNYSLVDFDVGCTSRAGDRRLSEHITNENPHHVNLFHINADQMPLVFSCLGGEFFTGHYNVGFWHWELPEFPDDWTASFAFLHEVWTPSQFVMNTVSQKSPLPVIRMPHAIGFSVPESLRRADMGLPDGKFLFLMMYDMHSFQSRKNPQAGIEAFRRAFGDPDDVAIVLKTMNTGTYPKEWAALEKELADQPGIVIINRTLSRQEVYNLESLCDCFLSLHRSEGFGLGLAESMYLGKPVIGTNWSGNVDFMHADNSCPVDYALVELTRDFGPYKKGQHWADADVDHAAHYMKKLVDDTAYRERIARAGRQTIRTDFSPETVGRRYRQRLDVIARLL